MMDEGFHRESYYIDNFISGLKDEIAQHLYNHKPQSLQEARELARGQEHYLNVLDKRYKTSTISQKTTSSYTNYFKPNSYSAKTNTESSNPGPSPTSSTDSYRKLTLAEITDKKQKWLCFYCDQKFEPGHNCRKKKLFVIMNEDNETSNLEDEEIAIIWEGEEHPNQDKGTNEEAKVSFHAITGYVGTGTLKIQGKLGNRPINILLDSGSTNNFISQYLAKNYN